MVPVCIRELRQALHDALTTPHYIETIGRQGYRFIGYRLNTSLSTTVVAYLDKTLGRTRTSGELFQQRLGFLQIFRIKPFREPAVNLGQRVTCFVVLALLLPQSRSGSSRPGVPTISPPDCAQPRSLSENRLRLRLVIVGWGRVGGWGFSTFDFGPLTLDFALDPRP